MLIHDYSTYCICILHFVDYKFHLIGHLDFEKFAATVVSSKYNIKTLLTFSEGQDGGRDAAASGVDIDTGGGNILKNQNLVVQVKHTKKESATINNSVFGKEKEKVKKLVQEKKLDTYIMFTNYKVSALQEEKHVECFTSKDVGAKNVIVIGEETLSQWLGDSRELQMQVLRYYPRGQIRDLVDCPKAVQSIQMLDQYREYLETFIHIKPFTKAKRIVESDKCLVFITGDPGSGKTTVARQLVVQLFDEYDSFTYYDLTCPHHFRTNFFADVKYIFFMDNMDSNKMNEWSKLEEKLKMAIKGGSKFVFAGQSVAFKEALKRSSFDNFYKYLCNGVINLSDQEFDLSKDNKQEMLKKHVEMGDIDNSTKDDLLKDDMLSHAAEMNCPCFPLVAESLGSRDRLEQFKAAVPPMPPEYNQMFLDEFFKWVQSTTVDSDSNSGSCASPTPKRPRLQSDARSTDNNGDNITGLLTNNDYNCLKPIIFQYFKI